MAVARILYVLNTYTYVCIVYVVFLRRNEASECMIIEVNVKGVWSCRLDIGESKPSIHIRIWEMVTIYNKKLSKLSETSNGKYL